jgi:hypothetical protein
VRTVRDRQFSPLCSPCGPWGLIKYQHSRSQFEALGTGQLANYCTPARSADHGDRSTFKDHGDRSTFNTSARVRTPGTGLPVNSVNYQLTVRSTVVGTGQWTIGTGQLVKLFSPARSADRGTADREGQVNWSICAVRTSYERGPWRQATVSTLLR